MSQQVVPVAVRDTVLDLDDKLSYAVYRGGQNISIQKYPANSATNSQHVYSIQVPSTQTIVSRNIAWGATFTLTVTGVPNVGEYLVNFSQINQSTTAGGGGTFYGADCLAPFPLNQMCQNMSITINNTTVSAPVSQILDPLLRCVDKKQFERWNSTCPTQLDKYGTYEQSLCQRVAGTAVVADVLATQTYRIPAFNSPFNTFEDSNCNNNEVPRGSFKIQSIVGNTVGDGVATKTVLITVQTVEPLFVSPFLFGEHIEQPGLAGITQLNITCQMAGASPTRVLRWVCDGNVLSKNITNVSFQQADCYMEVMYYTPKPSDLVPQTVVTGLATYVNYIVPNTNNAVVVPGGSSNIISNSIQLNSYPDKVFVYVDDQYKWQSTSGLAGVALNTRGNGLADHYGSISAVTVTLNNASGLLSTFSKEQLYRASMLSGCQQTYSEFSGLQMKWNVAGTLANTVTEYISTCGSVLILDFAKIIPKQFYNGEKIGTEKVYPIVVY